MLTRGAWVAALAVGACTIAAGGWQFAAVLLSFFISSTALSRIGSTFHGRRNAWQVLANGGIAAVCALAAIFSHSVLAAAAFAGAFAAANADTWATEIGTRFGGRPRSILTLRPLAPGMSGGITAAGTAAQAAGALFIGGIAQWAGVAPWWIVAAAGFAGALADSFAGAAVQEVRYCPGCRVECEQNPHACGTATAHLRGSPSIRNDAVNFLCTACGAGLAALLLFGR